MNNFVRFEDRAHAGQALAERLMRYAGKNDVLVLALPRGGVPVAAKIAKALGAEMDVFLVRKLGTPGQRELAMGAVATGGAMVLNQEVVDTLSIPPSAIQRVAAEEGEELKRRELVYRGDRPPPAIRGRTVILVDDGMATGSSMRAAIAAVRQAQPSRLIVAVPLGAADTCHDLREVADEVVCAQTPEPFVAVGLWYKDFRQVSDDEVRRLLAEYHHQRVQAA